MQIFALIRLSNVANKSQNIHFEMYIFTEDSEPHLEMSILKTKTRKQLPLSLQSPLFLIFFLFKAGNPEGHFWILLSHPKVSSTHLVYDFSSTCHHFLTFSTQSDSEHRPVYLILSLVGNTVKTT